MERLKFVSPSGAWVAQAKDYILEHSLYGETVLHGGALMEKMEFGEWLDMLRDNADEKTVRVGWVTSSTFFVVRERDDQLVGMVDIRHSLNDFLREYGGHIGYGVRPTERGNGYATEILHMAVLRAREVGLSRVMLACYKENVASAKTILNCGGELEREFVFTDGNTVQVYWLQTERHERI